MTRIVEATDLDSALSLLADWRGVVGIRNLGERVHLRLAHRDAGPVGMDWVEAGMDFDADVAPVNILVFGQVNSGAAGFRTGETEHWHTTGDVYLAAQPHQSRTSMVRGGDHEQALIDPALPSQIADTAPGRTQRPVRFTGYEPISGQAAQAWKTTYAFVRDAVLTNPEATGRPLLVANAARLLVATALATFPHNALADPTIEDRHDARPEVLHRALAYIDEHADADVTLADVAAAARVTVRAVQLAFRRHLDTTPTAYLRRVRLDHARHDLLRAGPGDGLTVTAVAYRWGFASPSRFASHYRQAYGVAPSYTLHQN